MPWDRAEHDQIVKTLAIACELTGTVLSDAAQEVLLEELRPYRAGGVIRAIQQAMRSCKYRLTLAAIREALGSAPIPAISETRKLLPRRAGSKTVRELLEDGTWRKP